MRLQFFLALILFESSVFANAEDHVFPAHIERITLGRENNFSSVRQLLAWQEHADHLIQQAEGKKVYFTPSPTDFAMLRHYLEILKQEFGDEVRIEKNYEGKWKGEPDYLLRFSDGLTLWANADPAVVEIQTNPMTRKEYYYYRDTLDLAIYRATKKAGLYPNIAKLAPAEILKQVIASRMIAFADLPEILLQIQDIEKQVGHVNVGIESATRGDPNLFFNIWVDFIAHFFWTGNALGDLNHHSAPHFIFAPIENKQAFFQVLDLSRKTKKPLSEWIKQVRGKVYNFSLDPTVEENYEKNHTQLVGIKTRHHNPSYEFRGWSDRFEIRPPFQTESIDDELLLNDFILRRIEYAMRHRATFDRDAWLKHYSDNLHRPKESISLRLDELATLDFFLETRAMGLSWKTYRSILGKPAVRQIEAWIEPLVDLTIQITPEIKEKMRHGLYATIADGYENPFLKDKLIALLKIPSIRPEYLFLVQTFVHLMKEGGQNDVLIYAQNLEDQILPILNARNICPTIFSSEDPSNSI